MKEHLFYPPKAAGGIWGRRLSIVLAGLLVTAALLWQTRREQLSGFRAQFEKDARARTALIIEEADESLLTVKSLGWFFNATRSVDGRSFQAFAAACLPERKGLQGLSWNPRVAGAERADFEQRARQEGVGEFRITERAADGRLVTAGEREAYHPARYLEPLRGNEAAVGFDVASDAVRRAALERARDTGEATVTEPIELVQQAGGPAGFLVFVPVYREGSAAGTVAERRAALEGFAVGVYQAGAVVSAALRGVEPAGLALAFRDRGAPAARQLMARWEDGLSAGPSWKSFLFPSAPRTSQAFTVGSREWVVETQASPGYMPRHCPVAYWLILPAGLLLCGLTLGYVEALFSSRERLEQLVGERTAELCQTQEMLRLVLDAIPVGVHWKNRESVYLGCNRRFAQDAELSGPEEIVGKTDFDLPWKEQAELFRGRDRKVIESGQPMLDFEQPRCARDGRVLILRQSKLPLRDAKGTIIGVLSTYEDITQRKQSRQELQESEARYRAVVEHSPDGIAVAVDNTLVYVNPAAVRLAGARSGADLLGRSILDFVHEDYREETEKRRARMLETGQPSAVIADKLRRPDGQSIDAEWMGVPIMYGGKPAILNSFRDVTEHRRRDKALRASEARYRQLHESMMDAFVAADLSGQVTDCNESFRQMLGYGRAEILGMPVRELTPEKWHASDLAIRQAQVLTRGYSDIYEKEYRRKDGTVFPVEVRLILLRDDDGTPYGIWAIVRDITARKQAEEALRHGREQLRQRAEELETIMSCAPVALWVALDPQCSYISGNRMASSFKGAGPEVNWSANVSDTVRWFREGRQLKPVELPMQEAARTNVEIQNTELEVQLASGRCVSLLGSATPLRDAQGGVRGCVGAFLDITDRKQMEQALRQTRDELAAANAGLEQKVQQRTAELLRAKQRLEELDRLKSQFLATMSHELRTPLNSIIGFTGILRQGYAGPVNEEQQKQLGLVFGSAKHLLSLINDLLDLSRIEAGKVEIERQPFDFAAVIAEVVESLMPLSRQKNIALTVDAPPGALEMLGDRKRCFQVLLNLANNALKFTERGQVKITACPEGEQLRVTVADTGIGIKAEQMGMLFEAFRQLDGSAKRVYEGTGLGLHLCRSLLTLMNGEISVESEFGKGSRFTFRLPRRAGGRQTGLENRYEDLKRG
jgi:PAS domain S-box-containing protein